MSTSFKRHESLHLNDRSWAFEASLAAMRRPQAQVTRQFSTPLARDLFAMGAEAMQSFAVPTAVPLSGVISPKHETVNHQ